MEVKSYALSKGTTLKNFQIQKENFTKHETENHNDLEFFRNIQID